MHCRVCEISFPVMLCDHAEKCSEKDNGTDLEMVPYFSDGLILFFVQEGEKVDICEIKEEGYKKVCADEIYCMEDEEDVAEPVEYKVWAIEHDHGYSDRDSHDDEGKGEPLDLLSSLGFEEEHPKSREWIG
ncbi:MAG: hypothetical protein D6732_18445 [Methanobacteriota archaeon]|nr:MAG: hypothetical protein D6732_18445 [Euryarchaeota archaeon]